MQLRVGPAGLSLALPCALCSVRALRDPATSGVVTTFPTHTVFALLPVRTLCFAVSEAALSSSKSWLQPKVCLSPRVSPLLSFPSSPLRNIQARALLSSQGAVFGSVETGRWRTQVLPQVTYRVRQCVGPDTAVVAGSPGKGKFRSHHYKAVEMLCCEKIPRRLCSHRSRSHQHVLGPRSKQGPEMTDCAPPTPPSSVLSSCHRHRATIHPLPLDQPLELSGTRCPGHRGAQDKALPSGNYSLIYGHNKEPVRVACR